MKSEPLPFDLDPDRLPRHVAVIMDGNGRWARQRVLNRVLGHEKGAETVRSIVRASREVGIPYLSLYAFSTENWERPKAEVNALMGLLRRFLDGERENLLENDVRLNAIGELTRLPKAVLSSLQSLVHETAGNSGMVLTLCLSYGSRAEILSAVKKIAEQAREGLLLPEDLTEDLFHAFLYTGDLPDPDLLIRTSGELRLSNFMLWQLAYSELAFPDTLWPEFSREKYFKILKDFQERDRRFGKVHDI